MIGCLVPGAACLGSLESSSLRLQPTSLPSLSQPLTAFQEKPPAPDGICDVSLGVFEVHARERLSISPTSVRRDPDHPASSIPGGTAKEKKSKQRGIIPLTTKGKDRIVWTTYLLLRPGCFFWSPSLLPCSLSTEPTHLGIGSCHWSSSRSPRWPCPVEISRT